MSITLYNYWRSSSSWRVRLALESKQLDYEYVAVHLVQDGGQQHAKEYTSYNSMHQVPTLVVTDASETIVISQSLAIIEYLDEVFPQAPSLPQGAAARAKTRQLAEIINSGTQPLQNLSLIQHLRDDLGLDAAAFCRKWITRGLEGYQAALQGTGPFSVGDTPTMADYCLIPQLYNARRFNLDLEPFARLLQIESNCESLEAFKRAHPSQQPDAQVSP